MERINYKSNDSELERVFNGIFDGALGNPILLSRAPTTANEDLKTNQIGFYSGTLYININGTTYSITLASV